MRITGCVTYRAAWNSIELEKLAVAGDLGVNFMPFVIVLMLGTSYAFINPSGYQTHLMVYGPGGHKYGDLAKVGSPLTLLVGVITLVLAPIVFPFHVV